MHAKIMQRRQQQEPRPARSEINKSNGGAIVAAGAPPSLPAARGARGFAPPTIAAGARPPLPVTRGARRAGIGRSDPVWTRGFARYYRIYF